MIRTLIVFILLGFTHSALAYTIPFTKDMADVKEWAQSKQLTFKRQIRNRYLIFDACPVALPHCRKTKLLFKDDQLRSGTLFFDEATIKKKPIISFQQVKKSLTGIYGSPWFDREATFEKAPTVESIKASGQALVTSWTDFSESIELRLDIGSTEGHALRIIYRPYGNAGAPASTKLIAKTVLQNNFGDNALIKIAIEKTVDQLWESQILQKEVRKLERAPYTIVTVNATNISKYVAADKDFVEERLQLALKRTGLVRLIQQRKSSKSEMRVFMDCNHQNGKRRLHFVLKNDKNKILWQTQTNID